MPEVRVEDALEALDPQQRLTAVEREALALLARGHTAKSIAALTGQTSNVINERLRSARRKCGVGSSRELARLLALRETWSQGNGAAVDEPEVAEAESPARPSRKARPPFIGAATVSLVVVTLVALAFQLAPTPQATPAPDPLIDGMVGKSNPDLDLHALHIQAHGGASDPSEEAQLQSALLGLPEIAHGVAPLHVVCAKPICEVSGAFLGTSIQPAMNALQGYRLDNAVKPLGLSHIISSFGGEARRSEATFVMYLRRTG